MALERCASLCVPAAPKAHDNPAMEKETLLPQERAFITYWPAAACMLRHQARQILSQANDRPLKRNVSTAPQGPVKCRVPIKPEVVRLLFVLLERDCRNGQCGQEEVSRSQTLYQTAMQGKGLVTHNASICASQKYAGDVY